MTSNHIFPRTGQRNNLYQLYGSVDLLHHIIFAQDTKHKRYVYYKFCYLYLIDKYCIIKLLQKHCFPVLTLYQIIICIPKRRYVSKKNNILPKRLAYFSRSPSLCIAAISFSVCGGIVTQAHYVITWTKSYLTCNSAKN